MSRPLANLPLRMLRDARDGTQSTIARLQRYGDTARIPELVELLDGIEAELAARIAS